MTPGCYGVSPDCYGDSTGLACMVMALIAMVQRHWSMLCYGDGTGLCFTMVIVPYCYGNGTGQERHTHS